MPIYEYVCEKCGDHLEVTQKMSDPPLKKHNIESSCGGPLKKIISMNSFHLKGTGWYKTDYAKSSSTAPSSTSSKDVSKSGSSDTSAKPSGATEGKKETSESKGSESKASGSESSSSTTAVKTGGGKD